MSDTPGLVPDTQRTPVILTGSLLDDRPPLLCGHCQQDAPRAGGCQITPKKWICAACWKRRENRGRIR